MLDNEDYTVGCVISSIIFNKYIEKKNNLGAKIAFCGFKKIHPQDTYITIKLIFDEREPDSDSSSPGYAPSSSPGYAPGSLTKDAFRSIGLNCIKKSCNEAIEIFESIGQIFRA